MREQSGISLIQADGAAWDGWDGWDLWDSWDTWDVCGVVICWSINIWVGIWGKNGAKKGLQKVGDGVRYGF